jgi:hypothetical protein
MKKVLPILALLPCTALGQPQQISYFKSDGREVPSAEVADYRREVSASGDGTGFRVNEYFRNGKLKLAGTASDTQPWLKFQGRVTTYDSTGLVREIETYDRGQLAGKATYFYPSGKLWKSLEWGHQKSMAGTPQPGRGDSLVFRMISYADTTGKLVLSDGNGFVREYDDKGNAYEEGHYRDGLRVGTWKGDSPGRLSFTEEYDDKGVVKSGTSTLPDGSVTHYTAVCTMPSYKGSMSKFYKFVASKFRFPPDALKAGINGRLVLRFVVEKDGTVSNVVVTQSVLPSVDKEGVRVLKLSKDWIPCLMRGVPVRVQFSLPITLST